MIYVTITLLYLVCIIIYGYCVLSRAGLRFVCTTTYIIIVSVHSHTIMVTVDYNTIMVSVHCDLTALGLVCTIAYSCMVSVLIRL
jgi:hypothetical protein